MSPNQQVDAFYYTLPCASIGLGTCIFLFFVVTCCIGECFSTIQRAGAVHNRHQGDVDHVVMATTVERAANPAVSDRVQPEGHRAQQHHQPVARRDESHQPLGHQPHALHRVRVQGTYSQITRTSLSRWLARH